MLMMALPALCLAVAFLFRLEVQRIFSLNTLLPYVPYFLILTGLALSWGFNNGREFSLLLVAGVCYWALRQYVWLANLPVNAQSLLYAVICVLLPINFLLHDLLMERGVLRWQLLKRGSILLVQFILLTALLLTPESSLQELLRLILWKNPWPGYITLTQPAIIATAVSLLIMIFMLYRNPNVLRAANIMGLIGMMLALNSVAHPGNASVFFTIATGSILIAIILNSYQLAYIDELTNLPSRRALKQHLLALGKRYSIAMIDIDFFKKLNDRYGHAVGDQALRMVAAKLAEVEGGGKAFRYGGEEFTIIFPNKDLRECLDYVEQLRKEIEGIPFHIRHRKRPKNRPEQPVRQQKLEKVKITVSAGVAQSSEHQVNPAEVIKVADKALYAAKNAGRNRVHAL